MDSRAGTKLSSQPTIKTEASGARSSNSSVRERFIHSCSPQIGVEATGFMSGAYSIYQYSVRSL